MSRTLNSDGLRVVRTRHGGITNLELWNYAGEKIALVIDCPCGKGDSGELFVQCPTESTDPRVYHEEKCLCYACQEWVSTRLNFYDVVEVNAICFKEEEVRADEIILLRALEQWASRTAGQVLADLFRGKKFVRPIRPWRLKNHINIDRYPVDAELAISIKCDRPGCFGRTEREFVPCFDLKPVVSLIGGKCPVCDKELAADVHLFRS